jgi:ribosomal protein L11 methylase PrmA
MLVAVDICENAVRVTEETLRANNLLTADCEVLCGNLITDAAFREQICDGYYTVVANITADVIVAMAGILPPFVGGLLILSGIIEPRLPEVLAALEPWFTVVETRRLEDWVALVCVRK